MSKVKSELEALAKDLGMSCVGSSYYSSSSRIESVAELYDKDVSISTYAAGVRRDLADRKLLRTLKRIAKAVA